MARFNQQTPFAVDTNPLISRNRRMGESSLRSDTLVATAVPRPRRGNSGSLRDKTGSMRDKMSRFREPSFRLLTGTRKLQSSSSNISLNETLIDTILDDSNATPRVRFSISKNEKITIPNLTGIKTDLWWSSAELSASRADGKLNASTDPDVLEYLRSYERAYTKVFTDKRITSECLRDLVVGLKKGYRGLEDHALGGKMTRKSSSIRSYVSSVVKHYHECCKREMANGGDSSKINLARYDSSRSLSRQSSALSLVSQSSYGSSSSPSGVSSIDKSVRNYSKKLSAGSRNFAQAMGRAEHLAVDREKTVSGSLSQAMIVEEEHDDDTTAEETE